MVEVKRDHFVSAIDLFQESLKIQDSVLGVLGDNRKLVQFSLGNLGYAFAVIGKYDNALTALAEVWNAVKDSEDFPDKKLLRSDM